MRRPQLATHLHHNLSVLAIVTGMALLSVLLPAPAVAQEGEDGNPETNTETQPGVVSLSAPNLKAFPHLEMFLEALDAEGKFIHALQPADLRVLENGNPLPVDEFVELRPGLQIVLAFNLGSSMAVRNSRGQSRYDLILQTLQDWAASRRGSTLDDWSLLSNAGAEVAHESVSTAWLSAVMTDTQQMRAAVPSIDTLFRAVAVAADSTPREGMGRAVLFVTPPLEGDLSVAVQNLTTQAGLQGIRIFTWLVVPTGAPSSPSSEALAELARATGGQFFVFTGDEDLPSLEDQMQELRSRYHLTYTSRINVGGEHQIAVQAQTPVGQIVSPVINFSLALAPPNPIFVSPVLEIRREPESSTSNNPGQDETEAVEILLPERQNLQILIDFPDGRPRPLTRTSLFVDGQLVQTHIDPPFDRFTWDLSPFTESGAHLLRVEAEDALGLVGSSMETEVQVTVERPQLSPLVTIINSAPALIGAGVIIAGAIGFLLLIISGKIQPYPHRAIRKDRGQELGSADERSESPPARLPNWVNRLSWPQRRLASRPDALFIPVGDSSEFVSEPLPVSAAELTLGSDASQAILVVDDPAVSPLHARLVRNAEGDFWIFDQGSIAGVWINYTPVPESGSILEHGDIVHFGRAGFRFTLRQPTRVRKPSVTYLEPAGPAEAFGAEPASTAADSEAAASQPGNTNDSVEPERAEESGA